MINLDKSDNLVRVIHSHQQFDVYNEHHVDTVSVYKS